jgi:phosphopantothenoylcysteine decarboxylase/phosphopantothenate--cysteine ligase
MDETKAENAAAAQQKTVLVGVTGCVAAYKACELVRALQKAGMRVKVVMTEHATHFIDPLQFRALTREPVGLGLFDNPSDPIHHISLASEADVFVIAPCTANVAAKLAWGIADDLLTTTALATTAPIVIAPAMNVHMYENPATQRNLRELKARGMTIVAADAGYLACGDVGRGRLADPEAIAQAVIAAANPKRDLAGKRVLVTAGPTREPIDPVRFITNHSSGKMGYAVARAAVARGAQVTLVSGPVSLEAPVQAQVVPVETAAQMAEAVKARLAESDIVVCAAAVADARPAAPADHKLKKGRDDDALSRIDLERTEDILAYVGAHTAPGQVVVGFAAETDNVVENARGKLERKKADLIVANRVGGGHTFGKDDDEVTFVTAAGAEAHPLQSKDAVADELFDAVAALGAQR